MYGNKRTLASTVMVITARNIELLATYLNPETKSGIIVEIWLDTGIVAGT